MSLHAELAAIIIEMGKIAIGHHAVEAAILLRSDRGCPSLQIHVSHLSIHVPLTEVLAGGSLHESRCIHMSGLRPT